MTHLSKSEVRAAASRANGRKGGRPMHTYRYATDSVSGTIEASSARAAMAKIGPKPATIADGAWAWVERADGSEDRLWVAKENSR